MLKKYHQFQTCICEKWRTGTPANCHVFNPTLHLTKWDRKEWLSEMHDFAVELDQSSPRFPWKEGIRNGYLFATVCSVTCRSYHSPKSCLRCLPLGNMVISYRRRNVKRGISSPWRFLCQKHPLHLYHFFWDEGSPKNAQRLYVHVVLDEQLWGVT